MDDKGKKPSLALIIAAAKKKPGDSDDGGEAEGSYSASPECEECVRHFFEAGTDGDYAAAASALAAAIDHIEGGGEEPEPEEPME